MTYATIAIAFVLVLGLLVVPAAVPALGIAAVTEDAEARKCIIGSDGGCIIPIYCFTDPCWSFP